MKNNIGGGQGSSPLPGIVAGLVGGAIFILLPRLLGLGTVFSLLIAVGGFAASFLLFSPRRKFPKIDVVGVTREMLDSALREGRKKTKDIRSYSLRITNMKVRAEVAEILTYAEKILDEIERDPADLRTSRSFLAYYFDATLKILKRYVEISETGSESPQVRESLDRVEAGLSTIVSAFKKHHARLLENDLLDMDTEFKVLEKTILMEGLGGDEGPGNGGKKE